MLFAQLDKLKGETMAALKAQGMEYEQRMEELEKLEWPKPNRDFIYDTFNAFADRHPWVGEENIAPKSVAREILERFCSFHDYVRDYGLQRAEGVLLRYLSDAFRAFNQSVPAAFRTPELEDLVASLGGVVRTVDSSLLEEWEEMRAPAGPQREASSPRRQPRDPGRRPARLCRPHSRRAAPPAGRPGPPRLRGSPVRPARQPVQRHTRVDRRAPGL